MSGAAPVHTVISEALIKSSVEEDRKRFVKEDTPAEDSPPIDLFALQTLRLSFKEIRCIDNLVGLDKLTKLCLDNNVIDKIENLDTLVNLQWLDLSFNNIQKIEGLEKLTKLKDLSLYKNQIEDIAGLEGCKDSIECLSLGMNNIGKCLESSLYLRGFKKLKFLNFKGNPMCNELDYKKYVLAFIDGLVYLDYVMIDQADVESAKETHQEKLHEIKREEGVLKT